MKERPFARSQPKDLLDARQTLCQYKFLIPEHKLNEYQFMEYQNARVSSSRSRAMIVNRVQLRVMIIANISYLSQ